MGPAGGLLNGLDNWLPEGMPPAKFPDLEFRITIRASALHDGHEWIPSVRAPGQPDRGPRHPGSRAHRRP